ncbi:MAG: 30S ribosomal protein S6 [Oscillospiraceae bacterium]
MYRHPCRRCHGGQKSKRRCKNMAKISAKYKVIYIIDPAQGEEGIAALVEKFKAMVEAEGTLVSLDELGKRRLAYPINDLPEGYYVLMICECKPELPPSWTVCSRSLKVCLRSHHHRLSKRKEDSLVLNHIVLMGRLTRDPELPPHRLGHRGRQLYSWR